MRFLRRFAARHFRCPECGGKTWSHCKAHGCIWQYCRRCGKTFRPDGRSIPFDD